MSTERNIGIYAPGQNARENFGNYGIDLQAPEIRRLFEAASEISGENIFSFLEEDPEYKLYLSRYAQVFVLTTSIAYWQMIFEKLQQDLETPQIIIAGHSLGEYTALVIVQSLDFEQATKLVNLRGILLDEESGKHPQTMLVINGQSLAEVEEICSESNAEVANENSDEQFVIAGLVESIKDAEELIKKCYPQRNTKTIRLPIRVGSHCSLEKGPAQEMARQLEIEEIKDPKFPFIANATGDYVKTAQDVKTHLIDQLTNRVFWRQTIRKMFSFGVRDFYEIGPQNILTKLTQRIAKRDGLESEVSTLSTKQILQQLKSET